MSGSAAERAARQELQKPEYHRDDPGPLSRFLSWLASRFAALFSGTPGGSATLVLLILLIAVVGFAIVRASTSSRRVVRTRQSGQDPLRPSGKTDHAAAAQRCTEAGDYAQALREWLRAAIAVSEHRGALQPVPGRTAAEFAHTAGAVMPSAAEALLRAAAAFDLVWFGEKAATAEHAEAGRIAAQLLRTAAIVPVVGPGEPRYLIPQ